MRVKCKVTMQHAEHLTLAEMREFLDASNTLSFAGTGRKQIYALLERVLRTQKHLGLAKKDKGIVRRYLVKISGLSKAQITRLIARWRERGVIEPRASQAPPLPTPLYARRYPAAGRDRCRSRRPLGSGRAPHPRARIQGPSPGPIRTTGLDLGLSYLQTCGAPGPIANTMSITPRRAPRRGASASAASPIRAASLASCGSTPCTRATAPKGKGLYHINAVDTGDAMAGRGLLRNHLRGPFIASFRRRYCINSPSVSRAFIPTTARSFSTTRCRNC